MTQIIGIGHYSRTGKDTLCNYIISAAEQRGMTAERFAFADEVKRVSHLMYGWAGLREREHYDSEVGGQRRRVKLPLGNMTPVEIWVAGGNKVREIHPDTWVEMFVRHARDCTADILVVTDVRFPNEGDCISMMGGTLVKTIFPGVRPLTTSSDNALLMWGGWDYIVGGSGELTEKMMFAERLVLALKNNELRVQTDMPEQLEAEDDGDPTPA